METKVLDKTQSNLQSEERKYENSPYTVGRFYFHMNEFDKARPWLLKALKKRPTRIDYLVRLLISYLPISVASALAGSRRKVWFQMWEKALRLPGQPNLYESAVSELAEYRNITIEDARAACAEGTTKIADEWRESDPKTADEIVTFYQENTTYIADLLNERNRPFGFGGHHGVEAVLYAKKAGAKTVLDFGSGDGSCALLYASNGFETSLADVSQNLFDFIQFRFKKRGLKANFYLLPNNPIPANEFDIITAFDTLEHVPNPVESLKTLYHSLKPGGTLILNVPFGCTEDHPMHLPHNEAAFFKGARDTGFKEVCFPLKGFFALRKPN